MDTFYTSEEIIDEIDIQDTEIDFGENFEHHINDKEHENNKEEEAVICVENEEKIDPLIQSITDKRGATAENSKVEIDKTLDAGQMRENILNSNMNLEQQKEELYRLDNIIANPEEVYMFPDYIIKETEEIKITSIAAMTADREGNIRSLIVFVEEIKEKQEEKTNEPIAKEVTLNLKLNIDVNKQEEAKRETSLEQSLLTENETVNEIEVEQVEEIIQVEEQNFSTFEVHYANVEQVMLVENIQSELISSKENVSIDNTHHIEQLTIDTKIDVEKVITEKIIDLFKEETQPDSIEEMNIIIDETETKQTFKDIQEYTEPLTVTVEDKEEKVKTLESRIIELFREKNEQTEISFEQVQTPDIENTQKEQIFIHNNKIIEINTPTETITEIEENLPFTYTTTTAEKSAFLKEETIEVVFNKTEIENKTETNEIIEISNTKNIQERNTESVEQILNTEKKENLIIKSEELLENVDTTAFNNTEININNIKAEKELVQKVQSFNILEEIVNKPQEIKKIETVPYKTDSIKIETQNILNINIENNKNKKTNQNRENFFVIKDEEKIKTKTREREINLKKEKTKKEAIILKFNSNIAYNTTRNEAPKSLEKLKEKNLTREEGLKAKPLSGHEILLQILGISQNITESKNTESTNSRSVPSVNQEEQETKSVKSIPSIYQQRNLNGITLKIIA
ncbi:MAG: hypothetical protein UR25_C0002G0036 [Candidatus Nomurabacteria bacterium GW2011_GWE1_32_28]|uniref:Uncharacterized protein n=1 Tax=Candidatus Nomurabacteria bacterium GW2011_GWF1_31_48 TaxID=1618767 RepID=A0A0G0AV08_9BACT|nr:MAG: hypothetical protein UR10_C0002G0036 [Candidatus Nomurabacteria bacterium GW2011_GWF2_30_133]KKP29075.1 MAG: hypothetical protein UR18_C0001G0196 [Candidatus Nomurabacteria bacterium GW2011_GWE2_31_40]KKP30515.1 MAG: hypothetical protein UR19_C0002G0036 [Candidatus Nomurabacteria bacterium GW2011_GWF1_31_48]KKP35000.1 MAG: hypothetical protein UR25_C0002G0036 [Candidatus Nomurabacteria bacterium GW2011_GWE1_32_28]HAS80632.1 hypothetical protein [Candidatus Nomurabacteria bacterium]